MFIWKKKNNRTNHTATSEEEQYKYRVYELSETGPSRSNNEDAIVHFQPDGLNGETLFAMVADGMGGHNAGEVASGIATDTARHYVQNHAAKDAPGMLKGMFAEIHRSILASAAANPEQEGMGTTGTAVFIRKNKLFYGHVGDSRLYRYAEGTLMQLTTDQTLVSQLIREGKLQPGETATGDMKHLLLQALGTAADIQPELSKSIFIRKDDCFLLCSDGIYDVLSDEEIKALLSMQQPSFAMECIKSLCYARRGNDNFSVILITVTDKKNLPDLVTKEQNIML